MSEQVDLETLVVIWEQCFRESICVKIPADGKKCAHITACARVLRLDGNYFLELQLFSTRKRFRLTQACFEYPVGPGHIKACAWPEFSNGKLTGLRLKVALCLKFLGIGKCWTVYDGKIKFLTAAELQLLNLPGAEGLLLQMADAGSEHAYVESISSCSCADTEDPRDGSSQEDFDWQAFESA